MTEYVLATNPGRWGLYPHGGHNASAVLVEDGVVVYGVEEERFTREKHDGQGLAQNSIEACLEHADIGISDLEAVVTAWRPGLTRNRLLPDLKEIAAEEAPLFGKLASLERTIEKHAVSQLYSTRSLRNRIESRFDGPVPRIEHRSHHRCHAASAFYPTPYDESLVVTADGVGEYDTTVVWYGDESGLTRLETYQYPNSLGHFYRIVTAFLGYGLYTRSEGKIMGLAPYGERNEEIERRLASLVETGVDFDVTEITSGGYQAGIRTLEELFGRDRKEWATDFSQWEKDLAYTTQRLLEETVVDIVEHYLSEIGTANVCLAGGVALNCKMNKRIRESVSVESVFIQPVAHDAGTALGGAMLEYSPAEVSPMETVYLGPEYSTEYIRRKLEQAKIEYTQPDDLTRFVADRLAKGNLVGWFQGRTEFGPRALGNRSILADPRTAASRDRVNEFVKHREYWRPFAPSLLDRAKSKFLTDAVPSPFMIMTFDTEAARRDELQAVLHPADDTLRAQTVREEDNPRYYRLIEAFEEETGVPVLLNTSFNDSGSLS
ncbi:carbamoyltransferase C-terminal domain-containing protein [Haloarculaceae archaeon H-GB2-1]|nr:carbamoyltransferase C-terminal domain-containing protein [Haloarculaceae archaeon H-GB2-1]